MERTDYLNIDDWARSSEGNAEFANTIASELSDLMDYMLQGGVRPSQASAMVVELVERVVISKSAYGQPERVPSTLKELIRRQAA